MTIYGDQRPGTAPAGPACWKRGQGSRMGFHDGKNDPSYTFGNIQRYVGKEIGVSDWFEITQDETTAFGRLTHDPDLNHIDPEWARENSPHGATIAFGFQTLSLLTYLLKQIGLAPKGALSEFNYGFDRIRWTSPVFVGARIRGRARLVEATQRGDCDHLLKFAVTVDVEDSDKPALVADWLVLFRAKADKREAAAV